MSVILPGTQSLVSAILTDGWVQLRSKLARRWSKDGHTSQDDAEKQLEAGHRQALAIAGEGDDRRVRLEAFWAGYLAASLAERPGLLDAIRELGSSADAQASRAPVHNTNTGTVGTLLQAGDIHGDISFGRRDG